MVFIPSYPSYIVLLVDVKPVGASEGSSVRINYGHSVSLTKHPGSLG